MGARVPVLKILCALLHRTVLINDNESHTTHSNYCRYVAILCRKTRSLGYYFFFLIFWLQVTFLLLKLGF
jgi:hypothetical protein